MMRSDVGRNFISTINAKVRRSYTESMLKIQAMTEEVREEEKKLPTKEEIFERVTGEFMRRETRTAFCCGLRTTNTARPQGNSARFAETFSLEQSWPRLERGEREEIESERGLIRNGGFNDERFQGWIPTKIVLGLSDWLAC